MCLFVTSFSKENNKFKLLRFITFILGVLMLIISEISSSFSGSSNLQFLISILAPLVSFLFIFIYLNQKLKSPNIIHDFNLQKKYIQKFYLLFSKSMFCFFDNNFNNESFRRINFFQRDKK